MLTPQKAEELLGKQKRGYRFSPDKFADYFLEAYQLLAKGHCQAAFARSRKGYRLKSGKSKHAASWCALGALERVTPEYRDFKVAKALLGYALGVLPSGRTSIASINDADDGKLVVMTGYRIVHEVLAAIP